MNDFFLSFFFYSPKPPSQVWIFNISKMVYSIDFQAWLRAPKTWKVVFVMKSYKVFKLLFQLLFHLLLLFSAGIISFGAVQKYDKSLIPQGWRCLGLKLVLTLKFTWKCKNSSPPNLIFLNTSVPNIAVTRRCRACFYGGGGPQVGEVIRLGGATRLSI